MRNVPQARIMLRDLARQMKAGKINRLNAIKMVNATLPLLTRKPPVRRTSRRKRYVTQNLIKQIKEYAKMNPGMHMQDIADQFGVNIGRVSEILNGKR